jgi:hypothetical protein
MQSMDFVLVFLMEEKERMEWEVSFCIQAGDRATGAGSFSAERCGAGACMEGEGAWAPCEHV